MHQLFIFMHIYSNNSNSQRSPYQIFPFYIELISPKECHNLFSLIMLLYLIYLFFFFNFRCKFIYASPHRLWITMGSNFSLHPIFLISNLWLIISSLRQFFRVFLLFCQSFPFLVVGTFPFGTQIKSTFVVTARVTR